MPVGGRASYFLRGAYIEVYGSSVEDAVVNLIQDWMSKASLANNAPGNLVVTLNIGNTTISVEITEPSIIEEMFTKPSIIEEEIAKAMPLPLDAARDVVSQAAAEIRVDAIRDPNNIDAWKPGYNAVKGSGAPAPEDVMPRASASLVGALLQEEDRGRSPRAPRSDRAKQLVKYAVVIGNKEGLTDAQLSDLTGVPRTTIRDARLRQDRAERVQRTFGSRRPGQPLTESQRDVVRQTLKEKGGNAAAAARELGLSARTVRDLRARDARAQATAKPARVSARRMSSAQVGDLKQRLFQRMRSTGESATEAARGLGIAPRSARRWARKRRLGEDG